MSKTNEFKVGDLVVIVDGHAEFYEKGAKARLVRTDKYGDWWANFRGVGNADGSFRNHIDGIWCIGRGCRFVAAENEPAAGNEPTSVVAGAITWKAQGDANVYALLKDGDWLAQVRLNGGLMMTAQLRIMSQFAAAPDLLRFAEIAASGNTDYDDLIAMAKAVIARAGGAS